MVWKKRKKNRADYLRKIGQMQIPLCEVFEIYWGASAVISSFVQMVTYKMKPTGKLPSILFKELLSKQLFLGRKRHIISCNLLLIALALESSFIWSFCILARNHQRKQYVSYDSKMQNLEAAMKMFHLAMHYSFSKTEDFSARRCIIAVGESWRNTDSKNLKKSRMCQLWSMSFSTTWWRRALTKCCLGQKYW